MAKGRYFRASIYGGMLILVGLLMLSNLNSIAKLGLPAMLVIFIVVKVGIDIAGKKAAHLTKRAKDADRGALAEEKVAVKLQDLPEGYHSFHDIDFNGFNVDHAVVGSGGIFLIETKSYGGKVDANGDVLLLNGKPPEKDFLKQTWSQTYHFKDFLWKQTSKEWEVKPVLCFTNAYVGIRKPVKGIIVTNLGYLGKFLAKQPLILQNDEIDRIARILSFWISRHER